MESDDVARDQPSLPRRLILSDVTPQVFTRTITIWRNGFTDVDTTFYPLDDPEYAQYLQVYYLSFFSVQFKFLCFYFEFISLDLIINIGGFSMSIPGHRKLGLTTCNRFARWQTACRCQTH